MRSINLDWILSRITLADLEGFSDDLIDAVKLILSR